MTARLNQPGVIGISVVGSYSRGVQNKYSDVDLDIFVETLPEDFYTLRIFDGKLVSLKYVLLQDELDSLTKPERAVWSVPGLQNMRILLDEHDELAKLQQQAFDFNWLDLQPAANDFAAEELMGCAEETHKIMGGLSHEKESKVMYASWGLFKNLVFAVIVQAGLMIESENLYFDIPQKHFGASHPWTRAFRLSFGLDVDSNFPAWKTRGLASLDLYEQTALLFDDMIPDKYHEVIEHTLKLTSSFKQEYRNG